MRKATYFIVLLLVLVATFLAGSWYNQRTVARNSSASARNVRYYVDPMHPAYKSDKPGIAPDCGMQLEPVYEGSELPAPGTDPRSSSQTPGSVNISLEKQQWMGVRVSSVEKASFTHTLRLFGRATPDETMVYKLNAGVDGYIREVSAVTTGSYVKKDQWLATFFSLESRTPIQAYLTSLDVLDRAARAGQPPEQVRSGDASAQLSVERLKSVGMSASQIEEIKRTREVPVTVRILAPADGFVLARNVSPGQKFEKGTEWYRIADLKRVWILADAFGSDAQYIRPGLQAQVSLPDQRKTLPARVSEVLPQFDPTSRTLKVRLEMENPGYALRPDMFVDVELPITLSPSITVPAEAVLDSGLNKTVFVDGGEGVFEPRPVETGWRFGGRIQIVKGLEPGERIVTSGNFLLDSESRMQQAATGLQGEAAKDLVCGMHLNTGKATYTSAYGGKHYHFCSNQCKQAFDKEPESYLNQAAGGKRPDPTSEDQPSKDLRHRSAVEGRPQLEAGAGLSTGRVRRRSALSSRSNQEDSGFY